LQAPTSRQKSHIQTNSNLHYFPPFQKQWPASEKREKETESNREQQIEREREIEKEKREEKGKRRRKKS